MHRLYPAEARLKEGARRTRLRPTGGSVPLPRVGGALSARYRQYRGAAVSMSTAVWLGGRDSNPDSMVQSHVSYRWTTSQWRGTGSLSNGRRQVKSTENGATEAQRSQREGKERVRSRGESTARLGGGHVHGDGRAADK